MMRRCGRPPSLRSALGARSAKPFARSEGRVQRESMQARREEARSAGRGRDTEAVRAAARPWPSWWSSRAQCPRCKEAR